MRHDRILALTVLLAFAPGLENEACGPYFPVSYFPHDYGYEYGYFTTAIVATNVQTKCYDAYYVTPHLGTELAMVGAHYYPAWTGKAPKGNSVSTPQADEADFFAAGESAGVAKDVVAEDWRRFVAFRDGVCKRLEDGENVDIPQGVPDYAMEFYLYKLGHAQWLVFRRDDDPEPFGKLLALPKERRLYRTVWVHFVRIANARKFSEKDRHLDALRRAVDDGFKDSAALEAFALRFLSKTCGNRYDPLVLTAYAQTPWAEWPSFAKRIFYGRRQTQVPDAKWIERMCEDLVGVEVAIAYGAGGHLPANAVRPEKPALGADRQAWIAFNRGDLELCRKLLAMAPARSLVRLFIEARLARLDGDYQKAAERLHEWLDEYWRKGSREEEMLTGYRISVTAGDYWYAGVTQDGEYGFEDTISYFGAFGPSGDFHEGWLGSFRNRAEVQSHEPTLSRVVSGELGVVMVATRDLEEALYAFLLARNWVDVAFVAERCMTVDELVKFMRANRGEPCDKDSLRSLLMRRLVRCGRIQEAMEWAPNELKPLCDEYQALSAIAQDAKESDDERAVAFFNLSRLTLARGMELMGTELRPDFAVYGGKYNRDSVPIAEPVNLPMRMGMGGEETKWSGWKAPDDRVTGRFHYRRKGMEFARNSVMLAKDPDVRAWALMLGGVAALSMDDAKEADWFYKKLANMHHPEAKVGGWFSGPAYQWFRSKYYDGERHLVPLRVPPRVTMDELRQLKPPMN